MKNELSILIPVYNYDCTALVDGLCHQMLPLTSAGVRLEIIVAEDGSTDKYTLRQNAKIADYSNCHYIVRRQNVGRAAIRNFLTQASHYQWLLFLDCDMQLPHDEFLRRYLDSSGNEVVDGGFGVKENPPMLGHNLRYTYEWTAVPFHNVEHRQANPYRSFRTTNFMIRRDLMLSHLFDERFLHYGYEDVLFGKQLRQQQIDICHIDNPMMLVDLETNEVFVSKTEESLETLHQFRRDLRGYSRLLTTVEGIHLGVVRWLLRVVHRYFGPMERRNLCGPTPRLNVFKFYKLGYYLTLTKNDK